MFSNLNTLQSKVGFTLVFSLVISACTSVTTVVEEKDRGPDRSMSVDHIPEPIPRLEPRTSAGNSSPYTVLGETYKIIEDPQGYREKGVASWYGQKFHGKRTANGELYDMYGMTAAHKTLPIPSYVRVTNIKNRRSVIVRVNDRGPFHSSRIIDLTYTAAKKLGFVDLGTADVTLEYIDPTTFVAASISRPSQDHSSSEPPAPTPVDSAGYAIPDNTFLQVGAFSQKQAALNLQKKLAAYTEYPIHVLAPLSRKDKVFRVRIGPLKDNYDLMMLQQKLVDNNYPEPHVVYQ